MKLYRYHSRSSVIHSKKFTPDASWRLQLLPTVKVCEYRHLVSLLYQLCLASFAPQFPFNISSKISLYCCRHSAFNLSPPVSAVPSPCASLTFTESDLTNLSHQPGNPTLPQSTVKVVLAFPLTQQPPTVEAQKNLSGMVMDVAMLLGARAAAGALLGEIRNAAGECDT